MTGSLLELVSRGSQDILITDQPEITWFSAVYLRYSHFSVETISLPLTIQPGTKQHLTIPKHGDLVTNVALKVKLPSLSAEFVKSVKEVLDELYANPMSSYSTNEFDWMYFTSSILQAYTDIADGKQVTTTALDNVRQIYVVPSENNSKQIQLVKVLFEYDLGRLSGVSHPNRPIIEMLYSLLEEDSLLQEPRKIWNQNTILNDFITQLVQAVINSTEILVLESLLNASTYDETTLTPITYGTAITVQNLAMGWTQTTALAQIQDPFLIVRNNNGTLLGVLNIVTMTVVPQSTLLEVKATSKDVLDTIISLACPVYFITLDGTEACSGIKLEATGNYYTSEVNAPLSGTVLMYVSDIFRSDGTRFAPVAAFKVLGMSSTTLTLDWYNLTALPADYTLFTSSNVALSSAITSSVVLTRATDIEVLIAGLSSLLRSQTKAAITATIQDTAQNTLQENMRYIGSVINSIFGYGLSTRTSFTYGTGSRAIESISQNIAKVAQLLTNLKSAITRNNLNGVNKYYNMYLSAISSAVETLSTAVSNAYKSVVVSTLASLTTYVRMSHLIKTGFVPAITYETSRISGNPSAVTASINGTTYGCNVQACVVVTVTKENGFPLSDAEVALFKRNRSLGAYTIYDARTINDFSLRVVFLETSIIVPASLTFTSLPLVTFIANNLQLASLVTPTNLTTDEYVPLSTVSSIIVGTTTHAVSNYYYSNADFNVLDVSTADLVNNNLFSINYMFPACILHVLNTFTYADGVRIAATPKYLSRIESCFLKAFNEIKSYVTNTESAAIAADSTVSGTKYLYYHMCPKPLNTEMIANIADTVFDGINESADAQLETLLAAQGFDLITSDASYKSAPNPSVVKRLLTIHDKMLHIATLTGTNTLGTTLYGNQVYPAALPNTPSVIAEYKNLLSTIQQFIMNRTTLINDVEYLVVPEVRRGVSHVVVDETTSANNILLYFKGVIRHAVVNSSFYKPFVYINDTVGDAYYAFLASIVGASVGGTTKDMYEVLDTCFGFNYSSVVRYSNGSLDQTIPNKQNILNAIDYKANVFTNSVSTFLSNRNLLILQNTTVADIYKANGQNNIYTHYSDETFTGMFDTYLQQKRAELALSSNSYAIIESIYNGIFAPGYEANLAAAAFNRMLTYSFANTPSYFFMRVLSLGRFNRRTETVNVMGQSLVLDTSPFEYKQYTMPSLPSTLETLSYMSDLLGRDNFSSQVVELLKPLSDQEIINNLSLLGYDLEYYKVQLQQQKIKEFQLRNNIATLPALVDTIVREFNALSSAQRTTQALVMKENASLVKAGLLSVWNGNAFTVPVNHQANRLIDLPPEIKPVFDSSNRIIGVTSRIENDAIYIALQKQAMFAVNITCTYVGVYNGGEGMYVNLSKDVPVYFARNGTKLATVKANHIRYTSISCNPGIDVTGATYFVGSQPISGTVTVDASGNVAIATNLIVERKLPSITLQKRDASGHLVILTTSITNSTYNTLLVWDVPNTWTTITDVGINALLNSSDSATVNNTSTTAIQVFDRMSYSTLCKYAQHSIVDISTIVAPYDINTIIKHDIQTHAQLYTRILEDFVLNIQPLTELDSKYNAFQQFARTASYALDTRPSQPKVAWKPFVGEEIFKEVNLTLGTDTINKVKQEWLKVYNRLFVPQAKYALHKRLLCGLDSDVLELSKTAFETYIDLPLYFNGDVRLAFPLIALHHMDLTMDVESVPVNALLVSNHPSVLSKLPPTLQAEVMVDYVYLAEEERLRFSEMKHDYIVEQVQYTSQTSLLKGTNDLLLPFMQPVKDIFYTTLPILDEETMLHLDQAYNYNEVRNYWVSRGFSTASSWSDEIASMNIPNYLRQTTSSHATPQYDWEYPDPITSSALICNGKERYDHERMLTTLVFPREKYNNVHPQIHNYSFAMYPKVKQPSGHYNLGMVVQPTLRLTTSQACTVVGMARTYNILRVASGFAAMIV